MIKERWYVWELENFTVVFFELESSACNCFLTLFLLYNNRTDSFKLVVLIVDFFPLKEKGVGETLRSKVIFESAGIISDWWWIDTVPFSNSSYILITWNTIGETRNNAGQDDSHSEYGYQTKFGYANWWRYASSSSGRCIACYVRSCYCGCHRIYFSRRNNGPPLCY